MFLLVLAVPAFLTVVGGYVVGHALWSWFAGLVDAAAGTSLSSGAEAAGWVTGAVGLVVVLAVVRWRWRRARRRAARDRW
ncbi:hypothetical protein [Blastococcus xanthinilyticus]|uniref:Uncharacterized protein n=1 Tax=Blastococcus xanthinilyticus TaxID=1564164 RepID=A0A5S5CZG5_9ACTN|nr:hypothetical protein [Blastococcus xanthinilyticus]TYP88935.1 hypothetical protein BD833_10391 [Blastococcus xanthinilyticus]